MSHKADQPERVALWSGLPLDEAAALVRGAVGPITDLQTDLPRLARDPAATAAIEDAVAQVATEHRVVRGDARDLGWLPSGSAQLVVTSPPYWTLKEYRHSDGQLSDLIDYRDFLAALDRVWAECFRVLVPGGRVVCVVGDVCLSRRKNGGRHTVVPLHASIIERLTTAGFDPLAPIIWSKIANAAFEAAGNGAGFLGKPYEPNAVIKNDVEYILMARRPGGYRAPGPPARLLSLISAGRHRAWFQQVWADVPGASTRGHPAPFPIELAERLIRMFSFVGDVVLDPFAGSGTTALAAARSGRNSISVDIEDAYVEDTRARFLAEAPSTASLAPAAESRTPSAA